jgi:hypothetical protein
MSKGSWIRPTSKDVDAKKLAAEWERLFPKKKQLVDNKAVISHSEDKKQKKP